jgi:hypothetical protein
VSEHKNARTLSSLAQQQLLLVISVRRIHWRLGKEAYEQDCETGKKMNEENLARIRKE